MGMRASGEGRLLCVGAVDKRGNRALFSNFGSGLGIVAPGGSGLPAQDEDILSTYNNGGYEEIAGTSQATPFVAGVAALLVSEGVRGQSAAQRILATAHDAGPAGPDSEYGAGIVDAAGAAAGLGGAGGGGSGGSQPGGRAVRRRLVEHGAHIGAAPDQPRAPAAPRASGALRRRGRRALQCHRSPAPHGRRQRRAG
jgi:subtilisin family serine protease